MAEHDFYASISRDSPRYADWARVFADPDHVPITTPIAELVTLPIGVRKVFFVKTGLLDDQERHQLVRHLAERFNVAPEDVEADLERDPDHSVPILDEDVSVAILHAQKWFD